MKNCRRAGERNFNLPCLACCLRFANSSRTVLAELCWSKFTRLPRSRACVRSFIRRSLSRYCWFCALSRWLIRALNCLLSKFGAIDSILIPEINEMPLNDNGNVADVHVLFSMGDNLGSLMSLSKSFSLNRRFSKRCWCLSITSCNDNRLLPLSICGVIWGVAVGLVNICLCCWAVKCNCRHAIISLSDSPFPVCPWERRGEEEE